MDMATRFKGYEEVSEQILPARLPVIIRLDGNSFSRLTKVTGLQKPFDPRFVEAMDAAATAVLEYCSGAVLAYCQSDEISILLLNDMSVGTEPFLGNRTQKIVSLCAAKASVAFNRVMHGHDIETEAVFDGRVFVVPPSEVVNYFLWRQKDAYRNCIHGYAYHGLADKFGRKMAQKKLHGVSTSGRVDILSQELDVKEGDIPTEFQRGRCISRKTYEVPISEVMPPEKFKELVESGKIDDPDKMVTRSEWEVDREVPKFNEDREYLEKFLTP